MKCFIAIDEDLLLKLWMLDPQLVAPFSRAYVSKQRGVQLDRRTSQYQLSECHLTIADETKIELPIPKNTSCLP